MGNAQLRARRSPRMRPERRTEIRPKRETERSQVHPHDIVVSSGQMPGTDNRSIARHLVGDRVVRGDGIETATSYDVACRDGRARCPHRAETAQQRSPVDRRLRGVEDIAQRTSRRALHFLFTPSSGQLVRTYHSFARCSRRKASEGSRASSCRPSTTA